MGFSFGVGRRAIDSMCYFVFVLLPPILLHLSFSLFSNTRSLSLPDGNGIIWSAEQNNVYQIERTIGRMKEKIGNEKGSACKEGKKLFYFFVILTRESER